MNDKEHERRVVAQERTKRLVAALLHAGMKAVPDSPNNPSGLWISLDEADKLLALLPVSEEQAGDENR